MITEQDIMIRLNQAIKESGIKQAAIAKAADIKRPTLAQYKTGRAKPRLDTFAKICKFLDLDANEILGI